MNEEEDIFVFFHSIMKKVRTLADRELFSLGINHTEMRVLMFMYLYFEKGCNQEELISKLEVDRTNVGRALKKLEQCNYIDRLRNDIDRRTNKVFLTEEGESIREQLMDIRKRLHSSITSVLTRDELTTLLALLHKTEQFNNRKDV